ncbi:thiopeptide-type bacteriocin biosynthesis protein [Streptosporangium saharense]|uniref:thiopeptide-type bacteriocin biosynthesis protein n=1 Tax=Streptosporangium saharense TaxID=1706840 RepID=UPI0036818026
MEETPWIQVNIDYPGDDPHQRERHAVGHLSRILPAAEDAGRINSWWFIRKGRWRVRYLPNEPPTSQNGCAVHLALTESARWTKDLYEPELHAFGGTAGMDTAHNLFHNDSRHLLSYLDGTTTDRRERSLVLCTALMRAAGLDFGEQGDVWARLACQRSALLLDEPPAPRPWASFTSDVRHLLLGEPRTEEISADWLNAFEQAGSQLKDLREQGELTRGIRAVTALHVIFHWNRIGIPAATQAVLAQAAKEAVFGVLD